MVAQPAPISFAPSNMRNTAFVQGMRSGAPGRPYPLRGSNPCCCLEKAMSLPLDEGDVSWERRDRILLCTSYRETKHGYDARGSLLPSHRRPGSPAQAAPPPCAGPPQAPGPGGAQHHGQPSGTSRHPCGPGASHGPGGPGVSCATIPGAPSPSPAAVDRLSGDPAGRRPGHLSAASGAGGPPGRSRAGALVRA